MLESARDIKKCTTEKYDLIIVGGGIYGVMLALEASRRKLHALLLEKEDFCGKTSHNHLRTVHGGIRYLQSLDLPRFTDSVKERKWFLKYFPCYVEVMPCLMPLYNKGIYRKGIFRFALLLNDILSFYRNFKLSKDRKVPNCKILSKEETTEFFPRIDQDGLKGGALWHDACLTDFQRFYIELLKFSCANDAVALNYVEVKRLLQQNGTTRGVAAIDKVTGEKVEFKAPCVINAAGPWARETAEIFDKDYPKLFEKRKLLWNVLFDREALSNHALALSPEKGGGHYYFLLSWEGRLLAGTPEKIVDKNLDETRISYEYMEEFINDLNKMVPGLNLSRQEIVRIYPGILPADKMDELTKRPAIIDHAEKGGPKGLYSIAGIKFTTSRLEADRLLNKIFPKIRKLSYEETFADLKMEHFHFDYRWEPHGEKDLNTLRGIIKNEAVVHLSDLILRRTSLGDNPKRAIDILTKLRELFKWPDAKWQEEVGLLKQQLKEGFSQ